MTESTTPSFDARSQGSVFGIPVAIVIAGGLIALAIYFGNAGATPATTVAVGSPAIVNPPAAPAAPTVGPIRPVAADDHVRGPANARVTIIEYSDLECPFCKRFHPTMQQVLQAYPQDVRWVYRHFPLEQLHSQAKAEAIATECANEQGKFWELLDKIYEITPSNDGLDLTKLPQYAREVGVANIPQFEACLTSNKYQARLDADFADAQSAGGRGTPYSVILGVDGQKIPINGALPLEQVKSLVDQALASPK